MTGSEARAARNTLGLSEDALAATINATPAAVNAWESDRIKVPRHIATELTWRAAHIDRVAALEASGLAECSWMAAFEAEPVPNSPEPRTAHWDRLVEHSKACSICVARDAFIAERFPPMPPAPRHGWMAVLVPIAERVERLPEWARPAANGALLFIGYSLFKLIFLLPSIARSPVRGTLTALAGITLSGSIGAVLGLLYGQYRRLRRTSVRGAA